MAPGLDLVQKNIKYPWQPDRASHHLPQLRTLCRQIIAVAAIAGHNLTSGK
jgi:hypothetical protein